MTAIERFMKYVSPEPNTGCWLWTGSLRGGTYGAFVYNRKNVASHRFHWESVNGPIPIGLHLCHKCDVPLCVNLQHMFLGTRSENMRDMALKGRSNKSKGESHCLAKLSDESVREIRNNSNGASKSYLSRKFGVSHKAIRMVILMKTWRHA